MLQLHLAYVSGHDFVRPIVSQLRGSCEGACTGPGTHDYCLRNGSFYQTCGMDYVEGCGDEMFGLTCRTLPPLGGCACTGIAYDLRVFSLRDSL